MKTKRVFLIVLDSFGVGELPDAAKYGDCGSDTFGAVSRSKYFDVPNMKSLGLFNIDSVSPKGAVEFPCGAFGRAAERSAGKDTTTGHWEIAGVVSEKPMPTFSNGFPQYAIDEFSRLTGRGVLCNKPYSGTQVILDYGRQHMETGDLIVYTSADSVFQIAAHEDTVPLEELYDICRTARGMLKNELAVGRVIARPFKGEYPNFSGSQNSAITWRQTPHGVHSPTPSLPPATAIAKNSRLPSDTALKKAVRSAQTVGV